MSAHRVHHDLYRGPKIIADPGTGKTIYVNKDLQICEMTSVGADETRVLAAPTKPGIRFVLRMLTDGGDIVVTASAGWNAALETTATFADAGDMLSLISVSLTATTFRWQVLSGQSGVGIATSSSTSSATSSATATKTSTGTSTSTSTSTGTSTATSTSTSTSTSTISTSGATASASATATKTGTSTATSTGTPTATKTSTGTSTSTSTASSTGTGTASSTATGTQ